MKVRSTRTGKVAGTKKKKKAAGSGSTFAAHLDSAEETPAPVGGTSVAAPAAIDALLAVQEVPDATSEEKRKARREGETILDQLEEIRLGLLLGTLSPAKLERLSDFVAQRKKSFTDPGLREILMEIELRARVELAKLKK